MAAVTNTVTRALTICGAIADTNNTIFDGSNTSERIANEFFEDNFNTCIDLKFSNIEKHWKTYGSLTVAECCIILRPRTKVNIGAFIYWLRYRIRMSEDLASTPFSTGETDDISDRYNTHRQWMIDAEVMAKNYMPKTVTEKMKWIYWKVTLINFLKSYPGSN